MSGGKDRKFSYYFYNGVTYAGVFLSFFVFLIECFFFILDFLAHGPNQYLAIFTYILIPPFLLLGLALIPAGALWKRWRVKKGLADVHPIKLVIDPAKASHRNALLIFTVGTFILITMSAVGAYRGFHYTESVEFCGTLCHQVMHPEHETYLASPHARVRCVECHVGGGATPYFRSKLTGARQVFKKFTGTFERPIPTPVRELRPAEETCMRCHWPDKFFGTLDFNRVYYPSEEGGPPWVLGMRMNVGGTGHGSPGVHAHMNVERDVYYAAEDEARQNITWVKSVDKDGTARIFVSPDSKYKDAEPPAALVRKMDCIDCHNRPSHRFMPPDRLLNEAMRAGKIDPAMPQIKRKAIELLSADYGTKEEALRAIRSSLEEFYGKKQPDYAAASPGKVEEAVLAVSAMYSRNMFPEMKARWDAHPDNIGHLIAPGCFRCHDGAHRSAEGLAITSDCAACHAITEQGPLGATEKSENGLPFRHPVEAEGWDELSCTDCHTGGT